MLPVQRAARRRSSRDTGCAPCNRRAAPTCSQPALRAASSMLNRPVLITADSGTRLCTVGTMCARGLSVRSRPCRRRASSSHTMSTCTCGQAREGRGGVRGCMGRGAWDGRRGAGLLRRLACLGTHQLQSSGGVHQTRTGQPGPPMHARAPCSAGRRPQTRPGPAAAPPRRARPPRPPAPPGPSGSPRWRCAGGDGTGRGRGAAEGAGVSASSRRYGALPCREVDGCSRGAAGLLCVAAARQPPQPAACLPRLTSWP